MRYVIEWRNLRTGRIRNTETSSQDIAELKRFLSTLYSCTESQVTILDIIPISTTQK